MPPRLLQLCVRKSCLHAQALTSHASSAQLKHAHCASSEAAQAGYLEVAGGHVVPSELDVSQSYGLFAQAGLAASQGMLQPGQVCGSLALRLADPLPAAELAA